MNLNQLVYFNLQRAFGSSSYKYYREFLEWESQPSSWIVEQIDLRLERLLKHAAAKIPYYQGLGLTNSALALADFPILTKEAVRSNFQELMTESLAEENKRSNRRFRYSWVTVQTGGSTGVPTTVIHDSEYRDRGRASRLYGQLLSGFPLGTPYIRLWGSMGDINRMRESWPHRIDSYFHRETVLNAFRMGERDIDRYIRIVNNSSASHIIAYVDAIYELARYCLKKGIEVRPLKSIMLCAGVVTDDIRKTLSKVFNARLHNWYGSRECAGMACECEHGGLHLLVNNIKIEVVDEMGHSLPPGKIGRVLVTLLSNFRFPMIRYEIGDMAALDARACSCGRPFPLLERLEGRTLEALYTNSGEYVSPVYIRHLIGVVHNPGIVKRFQLVQKSFTQFDLRIETEPDCGTEIFSSVMSNVTRDLKAVLGNESEICISRLGQIPSCPSGKFLYSINEVSRADK